MVEEHQEHLPPILNRRSPSKGQTRAPPNVLHQVFSFREPSRRGNKGGPDLARKTYGNAKNDDPPPEISRCVGQVEFHSPNKLPFDINPLSLLSTVSKRISLPRTDGYRSFKTNLKCPTSCQLLTYYFWSYYSKKHMTHEAFLARMFLDLLSEKFVTLFWGLSNGAAKDFFLEYYPYAIAEAVCQGFEQSFTGSRDDFTNEFKDEIFRETRMVFSGVDSTLELMQMRREQMGLIEDATLSRGDKEYTGEEADNKERKVLDDMKWDKAEMKEAMRKIPGYVERREQPLARGTFDAMGTSPLVRHYVSILSESQGTAGRRPLKIQWTLPSKDMYRSGKVNSSTSGPLVQNKILNRSP
mmetsp:Transcript_6310/g.10940  ORF Transcript_6310/g.10940 Transcript_6310/m.10940 type:complete len:355 (-) Transcript_6310:168-1232(-)|eukprot:CAMPEP_0198200736 /NCGR_PEP_ID=MMETSP1445-20131203/3692_1 /TAXON_ID=36898 /ORGANISM="Pyramimonas sp., Strain CCMP2087" /LENGTH=354 /DNA_ID=CAMNT_0043870877 /DNA_START=358 /DNA_END=1422 /DNA_ORIENTATION=+